MRHALLSADIERARQVVTANGAKFVVRDAITEKVLEVDDPAESDWQVTCYVRRDVVVKVKESRQRTKRD